MASLPVFVSEGEAAVAGFLGVVTGGWGVVTGGWGVVAGATESIWWKMDLLRIINY